MDAKALAKSKRAHSQHHSKKYNPNQKSKPPADGVKANEAGTSKKPIARQVPEKTQSTQGRSKLPSNWDRYEEELDLGREDQTGDGSNRALDVALPKSKGADYRHLISEAQSQPQLSIYSDPFSSWDNALEDWNKGMGSMLSVRGESILLGTRDDNFVVEDKTAAHHEVSFLSLNLHDLAEQLEKIDLPQRLFIEADLLPPVLQRAEGLEATCNQPSEQIQARCSEEAAQGLSQESTISACTEQAEVVDHDIEITSSGSPRNERVDPTLWNMGSVSTIDSNINPNELGKSDVQIKLPESERQSGTKSYETSTAEAELDMLLDSLSDIKIANIPGFRSGSTLSLQLELEASVPPLRLPRKAPDMTASLDDALDDLINKTSIPSNQGGPSELHEVSVVRNFQSSHSGTKSKELDDFDSWLDTI